MGLRVDPWDPFATRQRDPSSGDSLPSSAPERRTPCRDATARRRPSSSRPSAWSSGWAAGDGARGGIASTSISGPAVTRPGRTATSTATTAATPKVGSCPFRLALEGLKPGAHSIHINYDFTAGGHKAYDFLATWNVTNAKGKVCIAERRGDLVDVSGACRGRRARRSRPTLQSERPVGQGRRGLFGLRRAG